MTIPREIEAAAAPYLACFVPPPGVALIGRSPGARLARRTVVELPEGTGSVFLRLGREVAADGRASPLAIRGSMGAGVAVEVGPEAETWVLARCIGHDAIEIAGEGAVLRDVEFLRGPASVAAPWPPPAAAGPRPLTVRMDLTNKCNLRCRMCSLSFDEVFHQPKDYLSVATFERLAAEVLPFTAQLSLSAGYEPLLHPDFADVLAVAARYEVPLVELTTNGTLLDEEVVHALIDHGVGRITVSVDGAKAETFEHIRRGARFDRVLRNLETFQRVRAARGARRPELSFHMVLMRRNVDELEDVIALGARLGMDLFHSVLLIPFSGLGMAEESLEQDRERANRAFARARDLVARLGIRAQIPPDFDLERPAAPPEDVIVREEDAQGPADAPAEAACAEAAPPAPAAPPATAPRVVEVALVPPAADGTGPRRAEPSPRDFGGAGGATLVPHGFASQAREAVGEDGVPIRTACIYPWTMAVVRPDRRVVPCCQWHDYETMGSLDEEGFAAIWDGEAYRRLRAELVSGRFRPTCLQCPERRPV